MMFSVDDIVWAKSSVGKDIFWPSKVFEPNIDLYGNQHKRPVIAHVIFLGEETYEAIKREKNIVPFNCERKDSFLCKGRNLKNQGKRLQFEAGVKEAEKCIKLNKKPKKSENNKHRFEMKPEPSSPVTRHSKLLHQHKLLEPKNQCKSGTQTRSQTKVNHGLPTIFEESEDVSSSDNHSNADDETKMKDRPKKNSYNNAEKAKSWTTCAVYCGKEATRDTPSISLNEPSRNVTREASSESQSNDVHTSNGRKAKGKKSRFKSEIRLRIRKNQHRSSEEIAGASDDRVEGDNIKQSDKLGNITKDCEPGRDERILKRTRNKMETNNGDSIDDKQTKRPRRVSCDEENTNTESCTGKTKKLTGQKSGLKTSRRNKTKDDSESSCVKHNGNMKTERSSVETTQSLNTLDGLETPLPSNGLKHSELDKPQAKDSCDDGGVGNKKTEDMLSCDENKKMFKSLIEKGGSTDDKDDESNGEDKDDGSSDDESLPDVFSSSPVAKKNFMPGDVVWVKYMKSPFWPAQISRSSKRKKSYFFVKFLPKSECRGIKVNKKNIKSFTENHEMFLHYKNQDVDPVMRKQFEEAVDQAEEILSRRVFSKEDALLDDIEDQGSDLSDDDQSSPSNDEQDQPVGEADEPDENLEDCESGFDSSEMETDNLELTENGPSSSKQKQTGPYGKIVNELHRCKQRLLDIYREKLVSSRHKTFMYGRVSDKTTLKHLGGFGPVQDDDTREEIIRLLKTWYDEETKKSYVTFDYVFDVWLPEAMIYYIQITENLSAEEAENMYLDHARHVDKRELEQARNCLKNKKIDQATMEETVERAKQKILYASLST